MNSLQPLRIQEPSTVTDNEPSIEIALGDCVITALRNGLGPIVGYLGIFYQGGNKWVGFKSLEFLMRIQKGIFVIQAHHQSQGEHVSHVVNETAAIVFLLQRIAQSVNHMPFLSHRIRQFPNLLDPESIDCRIPTSI